MTILASIARHINSLLQPLNVQIERIRPYNFTPTMDGGLLRSRDRGTQFETVIDVGASDGRWTLQAMKYFPTAQYLLVEAQPVHQSALGKFKMQHHNVECALVAAGDADGTIYFDATDPWGGLASHTALEQNCIEVPVATIDTLVARYNLQPPYCIKLDTHGFEVAILNGASNALQKAALVIIECYNFKFLAGQLRFHEMCAFMEAQEFLCIDLVDALYRPTDAALWQADLFFIPKTDKLFANTRYC